MYFFTHLFISKALYKHFAKDIKLDKKAFRYGNIKPDITKEGQLKTHTLENNLFYVSEQANLLMFHSESLTPKEFSENLGVICHFICDFFCFYHLDDEIYQHMFLHFLYELKLHFIVNRMRLSKNLHLLPSCREPREEISSIIVERRKDYYLYPKSYKRDIYFALSASIWTCESIIYFLNQTNTNSITDYSSTSFAIPLST